MIQQSQIKDKVFVTSYLRLKPQRKIQHPPMSTNSKKSLNNSNTSLSTKINKNRLLLERFKKLSNNKEDRSKKSTNISMKPHNSNNLIISSINKTILLKGSLLHLDSKTPN